MLGAELTGGDGGIGVVVVLGLIGEVLVLVGAFVAIATGDGVADELDLTVWEGWRREERLARVEDEAPELGVHLVALNGIHQTDGVTGIGQGGGEGDDGVVVATEGDLEGLGGIDLGYEIATAGLGDHLEGGTLEGGNDLYAG